MRNEDLNIDKLIPKYATASLFLIYEGKMCLVYPMVRNAYMMEENNNDYIVTISKSKKMIYEKIKVEFLEREHEISEVDFIKVDLDINDIIIDEPRSIGKFTQKSKTEIIDILGKTYNVLLDNLIDSNYFDLNTIVDVITELNESAEVNENELDDEELIVYETYINKVKKIEEMILNSYIKDNIIDLDLIKQFYTYLLITEPHNIKLFESSLNTIKNFMGETTK